MNRDEPSPERLVDSKDAATTPVRHPLADGSRWPLRSALASLVALVPLSIAFAFASAPGPTHGLVLALFKVAALGYLVSRVWVHDVYALQWSSMFILLFMAEGLVRATSDRWPSSGLGTAEAALAIGYFTAVLVCLRPLKERAKRAGSRE